MTEYVGTGAIKELSTIFAAVKPTRVFLVAGKTSYSASGAEAAMSSVLRGVDVTMFDELSKLPTDEDVQKGIEFYNTCNPDLVVTVGGGHVMDIAKAINFLTSKKPLVAIPTTAGSGSEATPFAVVYKDGVKTSLEDSAVLPTYAIVDPALAMSVPHHVALASGLDALAQAVESYWAKGATDESKYYAVQAMEILWPNMRRALKEENAEAKELLMYGAHLAGKAIAISKTTACHALSYGLTARFGVPHGIAVVLFLPQLMRHNGVVLPLSDLTPEAVELLFKDLSVPHPSEFGMTEASVGTLVEGVDPARLSNNPEPLTSIQIEELYRGIL